MKKATIFTAVFFAIAAFCGCAPKYTDEQRKEMETRIIEGDKELVFNSLVSVLQDKGYAVDHSDFAGGIVKANSGTNTAFFFGTKTRHEVTGTVSQYGRGRTQVRVTFRCTTVDRKGTNVGTEITTEPEKMTAFFEALEREVFTRKGLSR